MEAISIAALDIAKKQHEIYLDGRRSKLENTPAATARWLSQLPKKTIIAMEATGGYGLMLAEKATEAGFTVYVLSPRQVCYYRRSLGRRIKSDKADAKLIYDHVLSNLKHLRPFVIWEEPWKGMRNLVRERETLVEHMASMRQSMRARGRSKEEIAVVLASVKKHADEVLKEIRKRVCELPGGLELLAIAGVGPIIAGGSLAALGQIPFEHKDAFVAWNGNDLVVEDSGEHRGRRRISSWGDRTLRNAFFNGARSACRNPLWSEYYQAKIGAGLSKTAALCTIARKMQRKVYGVYHSAIHRARTEGLTMQP